MSPNKDEENVPGVDDSRPPADIGAGSTPISHVQSVLIRWEAPLPPPALLEQYDQVVEFVLTRLYESA